MKTLLLVKHSKTGTTQHLCDAFVKGVLKVDSVNLDIKSALLADDTDLAKCHGLVLATPENFGTMSGAMKHFFDQTYYEVEALQLALPYQLIISAGNDGTGAERDMDRILTGYCYRKIGPSLIVKGIPSDEELAKAEELGEMMASAIDMGII